MSTREGRRIRGALCVAVGVFAPTVGWAQAGPWGNCTMTLQNAINDAIVNGYTDVYVAPGVYNESVVISGGDIRLIAASNAACVSPAAPGTRPVALEPTGGGIPVIEIHDHTVELVRLDVRRGSSTFGGNIVSYSDRNVILTDTWVYDGKADWGGGIALRSCGSVIIDKDSWVFKNRARWGGGVAVVSNRCHPSNLVVDGIVSDNVAEDTGGNVQLDRATMLLAGRVHYGEARNEGGCIAAYNRSAVDIVGGDVDQCHALVSSGGGAYVKESDLYMYRGRIAGSSTPTYGGGVAVLGGTFVAEASTMYEHVAGKAGGLVFAEGSRVDVIDSFIYAARAPEGGGIFAAKSEVGLRGDTELSYCRADEGGGLYALKDTTVTIDGKWSPKDEPDLPSGGVRILFHEAGVIGGGVMLVDSRMVGGGLVLARNYAVKAGGGIFAEGSTTNLNRTVVQENKVDGLGGGAFATASSDLKFRGGNCDPVAALFPKNRYCTEFRYNAAKSGGGAYAEKSAFGFDRVAFVDNVDATEEGTAILLAGNSDLVMRNVLAEDRDARKVTVGLWKLDNHIEAEHVTLGKGTGMWLASTTTGFVDQSVFGLGNLGLDGGAVGTTVVGDCNVGLGVNLLPGPQNDPSDPLFVNTWRGRYRLDPASPAIDRCWGFTPIDLDGVLRPVGNGDDSGAFEM